MSTINHQPLELMDNPPTLSKSSSTLSIKTQLSLDAKATAIVGNGQSNMPIVEEARQDTVVAESRGEPPSKRVGDCAAASSPREDASISTVDRYDITTPPPTEPASVATTSTKVNKDENGATTSDSLAYTEQNNLASILIATSAESGSVKTEEEDIKTVGSTASNKSKKSLKSCESKSIKTEEKSSVATTTSFEGVPSKEVMDGIVEGMVESLAVTMLTGNSKSKEEEEGEELPASDIKDTQSATKDDPKEEEEEEESPIPWGDDTTAAVKKLEEEDKEAKSAAGGDKSGVVAGIMSMLTPSKKKEEEATHAAEEGIDETPPPAVVEEETINKDTSTEDNNMGDKQTDTTTGEQQQLQILFSQINFSKKKQLKLIEQYVGREEILISHLNKYLTNKNKTSQEEDIGEAKKKGEEEESSEYQELEKTLTQDEAEYVASASVEVDIQDTVSGSKSVVLEEEIDEQPSESVEIEPPSFEKPVATVVGASPPTKEIKSTTPKTHGKKKKKSTRFSLRSAVSKTKRKLVGKIKKKMKKKSSSKGTKSPINVVPVSPTSAVNAYDTLYGRQGKGKLSSVADESRSGSPGVDLEIINGDIIEVGEEGGEEDEVINESPGATPSETPADVVAEDTTLNSAVEENTPEVKEEDTTTVATESVATESVGNKSKGSATTPEPTSVAQTMASMFGLSPTKAAVTTEHEVESVTSEKSVDKQLEEKSDDTEVAAPSFVASMFGLRSSSPKPEEKKPIEEEKKEDTVPSLGEDVTKSVETDSPPSAEETVAVDPATIPLPKSDSVSVKTEEATADNSAADPDMKEVAKENETELQVPSTTVSAEEDVKLNKSESMSLQEVVEGTVTGVDEEPETRKLPKEDEFPGPPSSFFKEQGIELHANFKEGSDTRVKSAKPRETTPEEGWTELLDDEVKQSASFATIKLTQSSKSKKQKKKDKKNRTKSPIIEEAAAEDTEFDTPPIIEQKEDVKDTTPLTSEESPQSPARKQRVKTKSMKELRMGIMKSSDRTSPTPTTASKDTGAAKKDDGKAELEQAVREYKELQAVSVDKRKLVAEQASKNEASEEKLAKEEKALKKAKRKEKDFPSKKNKTKRRELQQNISDLESDLERATTELAEMEHEADRAELEALDAKKEAHRLEDKRKMTQAEGRTSPMKLNTGRTSPMKLTMSKAKKRATQKTPVKELLTSPRSTSPQETFEEFKKTVVDNAASLDGSENLNSTSYDDDDESTNKASYDGTESLISGRESYVSDYTRESTVITSDRVVDDEPTGTCNAEDVLDDIVLGISGACCIPVVLADAMLCNEYTTAEEEAEKKREARKLLKKKKKMKQRRRK